MLEQTPATPEDELACSLTATQMRARRQFVRTQIKPHITFVKRGDRTVTFGFSTPEIRPQVEEFVQLEKVCCTFLTFELLTNTNSLELFISGPPGSESVLEMFVTGAS